MIASNGTTKALVDTNVFIDAADPDAGVKRDRALELLRERTDRGDLVVSVQVLNEFYHRATRPNKPPRLSHEDARRLVRDLVASAVVLPLLPSTTLLALDALPRHGLSFWDALIWAAAKENGLGTVYTEDFQAGRELDGVRFVDPFADGREAAPGGQRAAPSAATVGPPSRPSRSCRKSGRSRRGSRSGSFRAFSPLA